MQHGRSCHATCVGVMALSTKRTIFLDAVINKILNKKLKKLRLSPRSGVRAWPSSPSDRDTNRWPGVTTRKDESVAVLGGRMTSRSLEEDVNNFEDS